MTKAKPLPSAELVRELFEYDKITGIVTWKNPRSNRTRKGAIVGSVARSSCRNYLKVGIKCDEAYFEYKLHRIIWLYVTGEDPGSSQIDHIDGDGLNNSFMNLRKASDAQNKGNCKRYKNNSSGYKGVSWSKNRSKWRARIAVNRKERHLGFFDTPELAHMAYCKAAAELHGEFARGE